MTATRIRTADGRDYEVIEFVSDNKGDGYLVLHGRSLTRISAMDCIVYDEDQPIPTQAEFAAEFAARAVKAKQRKGGEPDEVLHRNRHHNHRS